MDSITNVIKLFQKCEGENKEVNVKVNINPRRSATEGQSNHMQLNFPYSCF